MNISYEHNRALLESINSLIIDLLYESSVYDHKWAAVMVQSSHF